MKRRAIAAGWHAVSAACVSLLATSRGHGLALDDVHVQVDAGQRVFATSCANCHGAGGKGAIGPGLIDKNFTPDRVRTIVANGRVGTPMPPFKDELDPKSLAEVIAYVVSISSSGHLPLEPIAVEAAATAATVSDQPLPVGKEQGIAARGAVLFFDPTQIHACRSCHSLADRGGPIGPDLARSPKSAEQVFAQLNHARLVSVNYPPMQLQLADGRSFQGIKAEESSETVALFDVSCIPPVKRTFARSDIKASADLSSGAFDHTKLPYSRQDRLDVSAYVGMHAPSHP